MQAYQADAEEAGALFAFHTEVLGGRITGFSPSPPASGLPASCVLPLSSGHSQMRALYVCRLGNGGGGRPPSTPSQHAFHLYCSNMHENDLIWYLRNTCVRMQTQPSISTRKHSLQGHGPAHARTSAHTLSKRRKAKAGLVSSDLAGRRPGLANEGMLRETSLVASIGEFTAACTWMTRMKNDGGTAGEGFVVEAKDEGSGESSHIRCRMLVNAGGLHAQSLASRLLGFPGSFVPPLHLARGCYFSLTGHPTLYHSPCAVMYSCERPSFPCTACPCPLQVCLARQCA